MRRRGSSSGRAAREWNRAKELAAGANKKKNSPCPSIARLRFGWLAVALVYKFDRDDRAPRRRAKKNKFHQLESGGGGQEVNKNS